MTLDTTAIGRTLELQGEVASLRGHVLDLLRFAEGWSFDGDGDTLTWRNWDGATWPRLLGQVGYPRRVERTQWWRDDDQLIRDAAREMRLYEGKAAALGVVDGTSGSPAPGQAQNLAADVSPLNDFEAAIGLTWAPGSGEVSGWRVAATGLPTVTLPAFPTEHTIVVPRDGRTYVVAVTPLGLDQPGPPATVIVTVPSDTPGDPGSAAPSAPRNVIATTTIKDADESYVTVAWEAGEAGGTLDETDPFEADLIGDGEASVRVDFPGEAASVAVVQTKAAQVASGTQISLTLDQLPQPGNVLVVYATGSSGAGGGAMGISLDDAVKLGEYQSGPRSCAWYLDVPSNFATTAVTVTVPSSGLLDLYVEEWRGLALGGPEAVATGTGGSDTSGSFGPTESVGTEPMHVVSLLSRGGGADGGEALTSGTVEHGPAGRLTVGHRLVESTGTVTAAWSWTTARSWSGLVAVWLEAAGGGTGGNPSHTFTVPRTGATYRAEVRAHGPGGVSGWTQSNNVQVAFPQPGGGPGPSEAALSSWSEVVSWAASGEDPTGVLAPGTYDQTGTLVLDRKTLRGENGRALDTIIRANSIPATGFAFDIRTDASLRDVRCTYPRPTTNRHLQRPALATVTAPSDDGIWDLDGVWADGFWQVVFTNGQTRARGLICTGYGSDPDPQIPGDRSHGHALYLQNEFDLLGVVITDALSSSGNWAMQWYTQSGVLTTGVVAGLFTDHQVLFGSRLSPWESLELGEIHIEQGLLSVGYGIDGLSAVTAGPAQLVTARVSQPGGAALTVRQPMQSLSIIDTKIAGSYVVGQSAGGPLVPSWISGAPIDITGGSTVESSVTAWRSGVAFAALWNGAPIPEGWTQVRQIPKRGTALRVVELAAA